MGVWEGLGGGVWVNGLVGGGGGGVGGVGGGLGGGWSDEERVN